MMIEMTLVENIFYKVDVGSGKLRPSKSKTLEDYFTCFNYISLANLSIL